MVLLSFSDAWPVFSDKTGDEPEVHCTPNRDDIRGICLIRLGELNAPSKCLLPQIGGVDAESQLCTLDLPSVVS